MEEDKETEEIYFRLLQLINAVFIWSSFLFTEFWSRFIFVRCWWPLKIFLSSFCCSLQNLHSEWINALMEENKDSYWCLFFFKIASQCPVPALVSTNLDSRRESPTFRDRAFSAEGEFTPRTLAQDLWCHYYVIDHHIILIVILLSYGFNDKIQISVDCWCSISCFSCVNFFIHKQR